MTSPIKWGRYASKSGLFLIELILTVFFFIVSSAVVLQLFVRSHLISERAICINNAILHTQNIAEVFLASGGDFSSVKSLYAGKQADVPTEIPAAKDFMLLLFDRDWQHTADAERAEYFIFADCKRDENFSYATIYAGKFNPSIINNEPIATDMFPEQDIIYRQEIKKYCGRRILPYGK